MTDKWTGTPSEPQSGDIIVYRERRLQSGPCSVGTFGEGKRVPTETYADALRQAQAMAADQQVDIWITYRARWADPLRQTYQRVAARRRQPAHVS
jgi:hypothetical protein